MAIRQGTAKSKSMWLLVSAALLLHPAYGANPLGVTVTKKDEAEALLKQLGHPPLGPRRCLIVTSVDPTGPCATELQPGQGLQEINGVPVPDIDTFNTVVKSLKPGSEVFLKGLYVKRAGNRGSWAAGNVTVTLPKPEAATPNQGSESGRLRLPDSPSPKDEAVPDPPDSQSSEKKPYSAQSPDSQAVGKGKPSDESSSGSGESSKPSQYVDEARSIPCVPLGQEFEGYGGYEDNDPAFAQFDYRHGPSGELLETVFFLKTEEDGEVIPCTAEGYLSGEPKDVPSKDKPLERQEYLRRAVRMATFRFHGRQALWFIQGDVPSVAEKLGGSGSDISVGTESDAGHRGKVQPRMFSWWWGGRMLGVWRIWSKDNPNPRLECSSLMGVKHLNAESIEDGIRYTASFRYGFESGRFESFWSNGRKRDTGVKKYDKYEGEVLTWYEDGTLKVRTNRLEGVEDGKREEWHPNGKRKSIGIWKAGELVSDEQAWDSNGKKVPGQKKQIGRAHV